MCSIYGYTLNISTKVMSPGLESRRFFSGMAVGVVEIAKYLNSNDERGGEGGFSLIKTRLLSWLRHMLW